MILAFDLETLLISHACGAPPIVCASYAAEDGRAGLISSTDLGPWLRGVLDSDAHITTANGAYDFLGVWTEWPELRPLVIRAYEAGRVHDVQLREQLRDIRAGHFRVEEFEGEDGETHRRVAGYSLGDLAKRLCGMDLDKSGDSWRLRYNELLGVPIEQWPSEARSYALDDARATLRVHLAQQPDAAYLDRVEPDQVRAALALRAIGTRGFCVDMDAVDALETELTQRRAEYRAQLLGAGIYRANGTRDNKKVQALCEAAYGDKVPRTAKGAIKISAGVLRESGDATLETLAESLSTEKLLSSFVPGLRAGADSPLVCEYQTLMETGRTSCRAARVGPCKGVQVQQLPRG